MSGRRGLIVLAVSVALVAAACGSSGSNPTQGPGGNNEPNATRGTGQATAGPGGGGTTTPGGGGGGTKPAGWDRYGKVTYSVSGPASASGELGFVPASSVFAGTQVSLTFNDDASGPILALRFDGANGFAQFGDGKIVFTSEQCTLKDLRVEAASASGEFDCSGPVIVESGGVITGGKVTGKFSAKP